MRNSDVEQSRPSALNITVFSLNAVSGFSHLGQFGILYPLMALWLDAHGTPAWQVGLVGSSVWLGMLIGNLFAPGALQRWGASKLAAVGCFGTVALGLVMPQLDASWLFLWALTAALLGVCIGLRWIGVESWLYAIVDGAKRGRFVGVHETVIYAAQGVGPSIIAMLGVSGQRSFYAGTLAALCAGLSLSTASIPMPATSKTILLAPNTVLIELWRHSRYMLGVQLGLIAGVLDGVLFGMLGIFFVRSGMTPENAALTMTVFGLGGLLSQIPLGWWSDRKGVRSVTRILAIEGLLGAGLLLTGMGPVAWVAAFLLGSLAAGALTAAVIATTHEASVLGTAMEVAVAEVSIAFTLGSCVGPLLAGALMDYCGLISLPFLTLLASIGLMRAANSQRR